MKPYARTWLKEQITAAEMELARTTRDGVAERARASLARVAELREWMNQLDSYRLNMRLHPEAVQRPPMWVIAHDLDTYAEDACL